MTIKTAVHTATMKCCYYDESSYQEWCHQGKELLMQYRQQQHARNQQQQQQLQQEQPHVVTVRKLHPRYQAKYKIQKYHRKSSNNKRTQLVSIPSSNHSPKHIQEKDTSHTSEHVIVLSNDDDNDYDEEDEHIELLDNHADDDNGGLVIMNEDDSGCNDEPINDEMTSILRTTVDVIPMNTTEATLVQSSQPSVASSLKRNYRSSDHLNDITMMKTTKKKKKMKNVFSARSNFALPITMTSSQRLTPDDITTFAVKDTPPQFVALIEGICTMTKDTSMSNGPDSYYASQRYHYLLDVVDHGHHHRLPKQGYATELPCVSPAAPGPWMVQTIGSKNEMRMRHTTNFFRNHQADWNGYRIRLVHTDYQLRIPKSSVNDNGDESSDLTTVRIDPDRYRMSHIANDNHSDCDHNEGKHQQTGTKSFIGAMGIVMFDGFASVSESEASQASLAEVVLNELRQKLGDNDDDELHRNDKPTPIIPSFTTIKKRSIPMECTSGSGGIAIPINVGCNSTESSNNKVCDNSDYFVLLFLCEATNQVVAIDVVFGNGFAIGSNGRKYLKSARDSPTTDSTQTPSLTHQNLQKHTSKWSTLNMLQRFWKKKEPQSPVDDILEKLSATVGLDEWTPHDEELVASTAHNNDEMDVVWEHDDKENSKPNPITFENAAVPSIPSNKEENKSVPQGDRIFVTTDLPAATPLISFPLNTNHENTFVSLLHRESLQVSTMMNQITPTPMQDQSNAMQLTKVGHTPLDLNRITLFPESFQAQDDCTTLLDVAIQSPSTDLNDTASAPTAFHRSPSSHSVDKDGSETSPSKSTGSSFLECCHQSMSSDPAMSEEDYFVDPIPDEIIDEHAANVEEPFDVENEVNTELHLETMSIADILFFELQNAHTVPEMSTTDVATWYEQHHADIDLWPTTDSTISLHDALFGGLTVLDPDSDRESFVQLFWYNWAWPMLTLFTTVFILSGIVMDSQCPIDFLPVPVNNLMYNDPSQGLLAPLMFVGTEFGYVGNVRIE